jgi:REP element-mobilizing transposase RayT
MFIQPYRLDEIAFAYCYRVYLRWRTHRAKPCPALSHLNRSVLEEIGGRYEIHVLEATSTETDVLLLASLKPEETVAACASKLKGQVSKWLRERFGGSKPANLLSKGYFACTSGKSTTEAVERYLEGQGEQSWPRQPPTSTGLRAPLRADRRRREADCG